jgi:hypothetical protein
VFEGFGLLWHGRHVRTICMLVALSVFVLPTSAHAITASEEPPQDAQLTLVAKTVGGDFDSFGMQTDATAFPAFAGYGANMPDGPRAQTPGTYTLQAATPAGWYLAEMSCTGADYEPNEGGISFTLDAGDVATCGPTFWWVGSAAGRVIADHDGDSLADDGEGGLGGFTVYADLNASGSRDDGEPTTTSDSAGNWHLLNVP